MPFDYSKYQNIEANPEVEDIQQEVPIETRDDKIRKAFMTTNLGKKFALNNYQPIDTTQQKGLSDIDKAGTDIIVRTADIATRGLDYQGGAARAALAELGGLAEEGDWKKVASGKAPRSAEYLKRGFETMNKYPALAEVIGFPLDIASDPLTYETLGYGALARTVGKGAELLKGTKLAKLLPVAEKTAELSIAENVAPKLESTVAKILTPEEEYLKVKKLGEGIDTSVYGKMPKENLPYSPAGIVERGGQKIQTTPYAALDFKLQQEGAEPLTPIIKKYNLSGDPTKLERELEEVATGHTNWSNSIYNTPEAKTIPIVPINGLESDVMVALNNKQAMSLEPKTKEAQNAIDAIKDWMKKLKANSTDGKLTIDQTRDAMRALSDIVPEGEFEKIGSNKELISAVKKMAYELRTRAENGIGNIPKFTGTEMSGTDVASKVREVNKELQTLIKSQEVVTRLAGQQLNKPMISSLDAIMGGMAIGKSSAGLSVAPMIGGLAGRQIIKMKTPGTVMGTGRMLENIATNPIGKGALNMTPVRTAIDINTPQSKEDEVINDLFGGQ
jgi:hypothetical protein